MDRRKIELYLSTVQPQEEVKYSNNEFRFVDVERVKILEIIWINEINKCNHF